MPAFHIITTSDPLYRVDVDAMRDALGDAATVSEFSLAESALRVEKIWIGLSRRSKDADGLLVTHRNLVEGDH